MTNILRNKWEGYQTGKVQKYELKPQLGAYDYSKPHKHI